MSKIKELESNTPTIDISNSRNLAVDSSNRISLKKKQVSDAEKPIVDRLSQLNNSITNKSKFDIWDFVLIPYDFSDAKVKQKLAEDDLNNAINLSDRFRFNSALVILSESNTHLDQAEESFTKALEKNREINFINVGLLIVGIIIVLKKYLGRKQ